MVNHVLYWDKMDVKQLREKLGMTSQELATALGVSISTVSRWENSRSKPSKLAVIRLRELESKKAIVA